MKKYVCEPCGYVYDPEIGDPDMPDLRRRQRRIPAGRIIFTEKAGVNPGKKKDKDGMMSVSESSAAHNCGRR